MTYNKITRQRGITEILNHSISLKQIIIEHGTSDLTHLYMSNLHSMLILNQFKSHHNKSKHLCDKDIPFQNEQ